MGCGPSKARIDLLVAEAVEANYEGKRSGSAFDSEDTEKSDIDQQSTVPKSSITVTERSTKSALPPSYLSADQQSFARRSLDLILPTADDQVTKRKKASSPTGPTGWGIWKTKKERQDFITATLIVLSGNGLRDISHCRIELFFVRVGMEHMAYRAGLAVMKSPDENHRSEAMAVHTYVARQFAVDQKTAFMELMFDIEALLESHLHNGEVHISRYGIGAGQNELESHMRNRAIKKIEEPFAPSDIAQAMNGLTEPYLYHANALPQNTMPKHSSRSGFVVGEVESQKSALSYRTTGGVGAVPYNNWMQPMPSRARQMHSHVLARPSWPTYAHHGAAAAARGYHYPSSAARVPINNGTEGFVPIPRTASRNFLQPTLSSTSSFSDIPSPTSDPRSRSDSSCYGSPPQLLPPLPSLAIPGAADLDLSDILAKVANNALSGQNAIPPPESPTSGRQDQHSARRRSSAGNLTTSSQQSYSSSNGNKSAAATATGVLSRPMKSTPNIHMRYYGLDKLEEDLDESELFPENGGKKRQQQEKEHQGQ